MDYSWKKIYSSPEREKEKEIEKAQWTFKRTGSVSKCCLCVFYLCVCVCGPFPFIPMSKCGAFCNPLAAPKSNPCATRRCGRSRRDGRHYSLPLVCSEEGRLLASLKMLTLQPTNHWLNPLGSGKILHQTQDMDRELWNDSLSQLSPLFFLHSMRKTK